MFDIGRSFERGALRSGRMRRAGLDCNARAPQRVKGALLSPPHLHPELAYIGKPEKRPNMATNILNLDKVGTLSFGNRTDESKFNQTYLLLFHLN